MRSDKTSDPRERILKVADQLFYAEGVRATGTEKIMSIAEVAKATFYRHFESKDALVLAYLKHRDQALWHYLSHPTPPKDLREALTKFEQYANWPEVIGCPFLRIASEFPDTAHPFHRLAIEGREFIPAEGSFILASNHCSHLDALILASCLPMRLRASVYPIAAGDTFFKSPVTAAMSAVFINALPMWRKSSASRPSGSSRSPRSRPASAGR